MVLFVHTISSALEVSYQSTEVPGLGLWSFGDQDEIYSLSPFANRSFSVWVPDVDNILDTEERSRNNTVTLAFLKLPEYAYQIPCRSLFCGKFLGFLNK